jgi:hypothetical protein
MIATSSSLAHFAGSLDKQRSSRRWWLPRSAAGCTCFASAHSFGVGDDHRELAQAGRRAKVGEVSACG